MLLALVVLVLVAVGALIWTTLPAGDRRWLTGDRGGSGEVVPEAPEPIPEGASSLDGDRRLQNLSRWIVDLRAGGVAALPRQLDLMDILLTRSGHPSLEAEDAELIPGATADLIAGRGPATPLSEAESALVTEILVLDKRGVRKPKVRLAAINQLVKHRR